MKPFRRTAALLLLLAALPALSDDKASSDRTNNEPGFVPMFNGKDLGGWVNVNCAPTTFFMKDGEVITTGKPTGFLRTAKQYENFIADFEWMHVNKTTVGNSGFFVWADPLPGVGTPYTRGIEVQVLVNLEKEGYYTSQGDLFSIHGATCKPDRPHPQGWMRCLPSENRCKGGGEWNHYRVIADNGTIKLHVNGKEVSGLSRCRPRKGYLALESEGAECHFRNLKIKELPSTDPKPDEVADRAQDFKNLYTGIDLSGWQAGDEVKNHWHPRDSVLHYDGKGEGKEEALRSAKEYGDGEFIVDFQFSARDAKPCAFGFRLREKMGLKLEISPTGTVAAATPALGLKFDPTPGMKPPGQWNRVHVALKGASLKVSINGQDATMGPVDVTPLPAKGRLVLEPSGAMEFMNLFVREVK